MHSRGLTLIEVLGSLAILGILVTSLLLGQADARRQSTSARLKQEAVLAADGWLANWWNDRAHFPRQASGTIRSDSHTFAWRTTVLTPANTNLSLKDQQTLGIECVRLTVYEESRSDEPLVTVDLALRPQPQAGSDTQ